MIDSHVHLSCARFKGEFPFVSCNQNDFTITQGSVFSVMEAMRSAGCTCCIEPASDLRSNIDLLTLSKISNGFVYPAIGLHPRFCEELKDGAKQLERLLEATSVVAIGEVGLDYYRCPESKSMQLECFQYFIDLADQRRLPLILHLREAEEDALRVLQSNSSKLHGGVWHCFSGSLHAAKVCTEEFGLSIGIGGSLLQTGHSQQLECVVKETPLQFILLETDSPYVKPQKPKSVTGKQWEKARNTSLILPMVAERIAEVKGISTEEVLRVTEENTRRIFNLRTGD